MKNILIILFSFTIYSNSFAQKTQDNISKLSGIWLGKIEESPIKFEILENKPNSFIFSFINFKNERFSIQKSEMTVNEKNEIIINIKEANFSSPRYEKCIFSTGVITISNLSEGNILLTLKSAGPTCWLSYDMSMNMGDLNDVILTKEIIK